MYVCVWGVYVCMCVLRLIVDSYFNSVYYALYRIACVQGNYFILVYCFITMTSYNMRSYRHKRNFLFLICSYKFVYPRQE